MFFHNHFVQLHHHHHQAILIQAIITQVDQALALLYHRYLQLVDHPSSSGSGSWNMGTGSSSSEIQVESFQFQEHQVEPFQFLEHQVGGNIPGGSSPSIGGKFTKDDSISCHIYLTN